MAQLRVSQSVQIRPLPATQRWRHRQRLRPPSANPARNAGGQPTITVSRSGYLFDTLATQYTIVRVQRSTDLLNWQEIFRDDENFGSLTQAGYEVQNDFATKSFTITETADPPAPRAWYRVEALLIEGEP